jgi:hypothetical protein
VPLNYRKNNINYNIQYYDNISDLNGPSIRQDRRFNIVVNGQTKYIGLVSSGHIQSSDIQTRTNNENLILAKQSKYDNTKSQWLNYQQPEGLSYPSNYVIPQVSTSVSYTPTLTSNGVGALTYSISPSLPSGLNFNTSNGIISGTTPSASNDNTYTITVNNTFGSSSTTIRIRIVLKYFTITASSYDSGAALLYGFDDVGITTNDAGGLYGSISDSAFKSLRIRVLSYRNQKAYTYKQVRMMFFYYPQNSNPDYTYLISVRDNKTSFFSKIDINNGSNILYSSQTTTGIDGFNDFVGVYFDWNDIYPNNIFPSGNYPIIIE